MKKVSKLNYMYIVQPFVAFDVKWVPHVSETHRISIKIVNNSSH